MTPRPRLVKNERCDYLRPTVIHCTNAEPAIAKAWELYDIHLVLERNWDRLGPKLNQTLVRAHPDVSFAIFFHANGGGFLQILSQIDSLPAGRMGRPI